MKFSIRFLIIIIFGQGFNIYADYNYISTKIYHYTPHYRINTYIGLKSQNRINFGNYGIKEIIGDESRYQLVHDSMGNNIFILPKVAIGEIIDITIVSNSNKVQDLSLKIIDDFGQTIIIYDR
jgi:hypothetical protein